MPKFAKYALVFLIGYWCCHVGGPIIAMHIIAHFLNGIG